MVFRETKSSEPGIATSDFSQVPWEFHYYSLDWTGNVPYTRYLPKAACHEPSQTAATDVLLAEVGHWVTCCNYYNVWVKNLSD